MKKIKLLISTLSISLLCHFDSNAGIYITREALGDSGNVDFVANNHTSGVGYALAHHLFTGMPETWEANNTYPRPIPPSALTAFKFTYIYSGITCVFSDNTTAVDATSGYKVYSTVKLPYMFKLYVKKNPLTTDGQNHYSFYVTVSCCLGIVP